MKFLGNGQSGDTTADDQYTLRVGFHANEVGKTARAKPEIVADKAGDVNKKKFQRYAR